MLYFTDHRGLNKKNWLSTQNFIATSNRQAWNQTAPLSEPFMAQFRGIDEFSRKRKKQAEKGLEFNAYSHQDSVWAARMQSSNSLRSYKCIQGSIQSLRGSVLTSERKKGDATSFRSSVI
mmetsp:Transcript_47764/g.35015  ORF Transcript_47764/g.35015 Transcript_47764/m.35015 type:complete len:120 (-) Transcript_47764:550-909(-)|eukprot:CAMPEP_0202962782 /NCGR_PEP_ID=MMETSP1396-20130829/6838_1 /ASSEMBLY_ACC=CAM_ASM_000872 /TAXON_ID= /ORGANISM="Pseudokeronopsis sp., Strain Brazil" /LENGTH=119 /DNA_ID=CAMNT_0049683547 /DNA_START=457 /DNA_END=816 /DNA_ORIENTATION=-